MCRLFKAARASIVCVRRWESTTRPLIATRIDPWDCGPGTPLKTCHTEPRNVWTVVADSCARVTAYCSVFNVEYDISCGSPDPSRSSLFAYTSGRLTRARRGIRDSAARDF